MRIWRELLETARQAPSAHNAQPWRVRVLGELQAELLVDATRMFPVTDPDGWETIVSLGAFAETLSIAAAPRGLELRVALSGVPLWEREGLIRYARLVLVQRREPEPLAAELIGRRCSSRLPYDGRPVPADVAAELSAIAASAHHRLTVSSDPAVTALVVELGAEAQAFPAVDPGVRAELATWLRLSNRAAERTRDGLSARCLNAPGSLLRFWFRFPGLVRLPGIRGLATRQRLRSMAGTASVAWIAGTPSTDEDWFNAGRMLCRLWLTATRHGLYLHPLVSVLAMDRLQARLLEHLGEQAGPGAPWFLARIGSGPEPPRSLRLRVDDLLEGG